MQIFVSAGEPSGDLHGANFVRAFRRLRPDAEFVGFGGERMEAAGCRLLYPLVQLAVMWLLRVLANLHVFLGVLSKADRWFRHRRPDAVVLIDYPGLHWWLARRAKFHGIPVFYFVPPQIWAWASWRVKKMQRFVDHVLCSLPFEKEWYAARGVNAEYVGHPYFDELHRRPLDDGFLAAVNPRGERGKRSPIVALLPGSRNQEVLHNFPSMIRAAEQIAAGVPGVRFLVANFKEAHRHACTKMLAGARSIGGTADTAVPKRPDIEFHVGRTAEIIHLADACIAVSGSVSLELLHAHKPTVVVYRVSSLGLRLTRRYMSAKYITLVNLLADRELFPEFLTDRCPAKPAAEWIVRWLTGNAERLERVEELRQLHARVGLPGACDRAAALVLDRLACSKGRRQTKRRDAVKMEHAPGSRKMAS